MMSGANLDAWRCSNVESYHMSWAIPESFSHMNGDMSGSLGGTHHQTFKNRPPRDPRSTSHIVPQNVFIQYLVALACVYISPRVSSDCDRRDVVTNTIAHSHIRHVALSILEWQGRRIRGHVGCRISQMQFQRILSSSLEYERSFNYSIVYCHWQFGLVVVFVSIDE